MTDLVSATDATLTPAAPVPAEQRVISLDVIRGLAVLGILVMNVVEFGMPLRAYENPAGGGGSTGLDLWVWYAQIALFDGRMRALFSMLFGAGMVLIAERMQRVGRGGEAADLLLRRCLWLVPFGLAHRFALQWTGDILYMYGLFGALAVVFRRARPRVQLGLGIACLLMFVPIEAWHHHQAAAQREQAEQAATLRSAGQPVPEELHQAEVRWQRRSEAPRPEAVDPELAAVRGDYATVFAYRWDYHHSFQSAYLYYYFVWDVLGMMLVGMALGQLGFFAGRAPAGVYWALLLAGAVLAAASLLWAQEFAARAFSSAELALHSLKEMSYGVVRGVVGLAWASGLVLLLRAGRLRALTHTLASVGRLAFSNYVLQTVCCTLFFFGYGLGYYGSLSRSQLMLVWLAVSAVQIAFSLAWLRWFRFGPLEWLWRWLTYGRRPAFLARRVA